MHAHKGVRVRATMLYLNFLNERFITFFQNVMCFGSMGIAPEKLAIINSIPSFPFSMSPCILSNNSTKNACIIKKHLNTTGYFITQMYNDYYYFRDSTSSIKS